MVCFMHIIANTGKEVMNNNKNNNKIITIIIIVKHNQSQTFTACLQNCNKSVFDVYACPSVCMEQLGYQWADFHEICHSSIIFRNPVKKIQVSLKMTRIKGTVHAVQYIFLIDISLNSSQNETRSRQKCRKHQNTHFMFNSFFFF